MVAHDWLDRRGLTHRDAAAVVCGRETVTFGELRMRSRALASALAEHGAGKDGPVGVLLPNSVELAYTYYACSYLGAPFLPFDPRLADEEIVRQCAAARPRALITRAEYAGLASSIGESTPDCKIVISARGNWPDSSPIQPLHLAEVLESELAGISNTSENGWTNTWSLRDSSVREAQSGLSNNTSQSSQATALAEDGTASKATFKRRSFCQRTSRPRIRIRISASFSESSGCEPYTSSTATKGTSSAR